MRLTHETKCSSIFGVDGVVYKVVDNVVDIPDAACPSNIWSFGYILAPAIIPAVADEPAAEPIDTTNLGEQNGPV